jgi:hypothetical protein
VEIGRTAVVVVMVMRIKRSMLSNTMKRAKPARSTAPVNPPSAFTLPVPKLNRELDAFEFGNPVGANHTGEL